MKRSQVFKGVIMGATSGLLLLLMVIPVRLAIAAQQAPQPQAILVLGGGEGREEAAAQLARLYPQLDIWVSTGKSPQHAYSIFQDAGISYDRVHLDYRAKDTVTNFTTLVADFSNQDIHHLYILTSDCHMPRAKAIATIVLGSQGIAFTPVAIPSDRSPESALRIARDVGRSLLWIATGRTGASLGERISRQGSVEQEQGFLAQKVAKLAAKLRDLGVIDPQTGKP